MGPFYSIMTIVARGKPVSYCSTRTAAQGKLRKEQTGIKVPAFPARDPCPDTVLVVDDNKDLVKLITILLTHQGLTVRPAHSGPECLEVARSERVDLVILDVMMPGPDGLSVCEELKRILPSLPVMMLTAKDEMDTRIRANALGVCEFMSKPVNNVDLLARVQKQLRTRRRE
jgi:DNA-binding response OmpR family regulator